MSLPDTNAVMRAYLAADAGIIAFFAPDAPRIYCPRLPEGADLPAIGFFTRGGSASPYIPDIPTPSVQFDCWADSPIVARELYRKLYDALQGIQMVAVGANMIKSAREEVQGVDMVDEIPNYFRVLSFFEIKVC